VAGLVARRGRQDAPIGRRARFARLPCWPRAPRNRHTVTRPSTSAMPIDGDAVAIGMTNGSDQDLANSTWRRTVDMVLLPCMQRACSRATNHATRTVNIGKRLMCRDNFPGAARQAGLSAPRQPANLDRQERGAHEQGTDRKHAYRFLCLRPLRASLLGFVFGAGYGPFWRASQGPASRRRAHRANPAPTQPRPPLRLPPNCVDRTGDRRHRDRGQWRHQRISRNSPRRTDRQPRPGAFHANPGPGRISGAASGYCGDTATAMASIVDLP
jgi:hypothetical protein